MQTKTLVKWEEKPLNEICIFKSGTTIDKKLEKESGDILYVKVGDMNLPSNQVEIVTSSRFTNYQDINNVQIIPIGSVIFPKRGGAIATNKKRRIIKPTIVDLNTMAIKCKDELSDDYFYHWFNTIDLIKISNGTTIPQINNYSFDNLKICYPISITEQLRIVEILNKAFEDIEQIKENAKQNLQNAKDLFDSYLEQVFNQNSEEYFVTTFGEEIKVRSGDFLPAKSMAQDGSYPVYGGNGVNGNHDQHNYSNENVIIGRVGEKCGNVHYVNQNIWVTDNAFVVIGTKNQFDKKFLTILLRRANLRNYAKKSTHPVISGTSLSDVKLSFPLSILKQKEIVKQLDDLQEETKQLEQIYQQKIKQAEELKQSILQKAFNGEL